MHKNYPKHFSLKFILIHCTIFVFFVVYSKLLSFFINFVCLIFIAKPAFILLSTEENFLSQFGRGMASCKSLKEDLRRLELCFPKTGLPLRVAKANLDEVCFLFIQNGKSLEITANFPVSNPF